MTTTQIEGLVTPGFEKVADAFTGNLRSRGDTAAACAVYADGQVVVDIWAGSTARGPWTRNTRSVLFSVSKGVTAICLLMACEAGLIDLDAPVAAYWPKFGVNGKTGVTVRHVLAHRAGLPAPDVPLTAADAAAWQPAVDALARQAPLWTPGTNFAYHAITVGFLAGEILRRATSKRPADWLQAHIATPLNLTTMSFGADPDAPDFAPQLEQMPIEDAAGAAALMPADVDLVNRAIGMGGVFDGTDLFAAANTDAFLSYESPAANLVASAHDLARLYAATVRPVDGVRLLGDDIVIDARRPQSEGVSYFGLDDGNRWGTGFMLNSRRRSMAGPRSFGHDGAGGQLGFAHLEFGIGFGYQTVRPGGFPDERAETICAALRECL